MKLPVAMSPMGKRCAIYTWKPAGAGVGSDFNSLDAQRDACAEYVRRQPGWNLLDQRYDDDGDTGATVEYPAFQRLLADVDAGQIDIILVYKLEQLRRSLIDFAQLLTRFDAASVSFIAVAQNFSTSEPTGRLTAQFLSAFAELERKLIAERARDKIARARRRGKWTGGPVPLGYTVTDGKLAVHEAEAIVVREIFALYLEHRAIVDVVRVLNGRRRTTTQPCSANNRTRTGHAWTKRDVQRILHNPLYAGYVRNGGKGGELCDGEHRALISRDVFSRTAAALAAATPPPRGAPGSHEYLLRGLLRCASCGAEFTTASTRTSGATYRYYRCLTRDEQGARACHAKPLPAGAIEAYVLDHVRSAIRDADRELVTEVTAAVQTRVRDRRDELRTECSMLLRQIAVLRAEERFTDTVATEDEPLQCTSSATRLGPLEAQLGAAERELAQLEDLDIETSWVGRCLRDPERIWNVLTPANRARLVRTVVDHVEVDESADKVTLSLADLTSRISAVDALALAISDAR